MRVREQLIKANRLEEVIDKLKLIVDTKDCDFPVQLFMDTDNVAKYRVSGDKVRKQAKLLLEQIERDDIVYNSDFEHLYQLITSRAEMDMHNYANHVLHRMISDVDLENTRVLVIIKSIIDSVTICTEEDLPWDIPAGWAKLD